MQLSFYLVQPLVDRALEEDLGTGDVTTDAIVPADLRCRAHFIAKSEGVIAGLEMARLVFETLDAEGWFEEEVQDGDAVAAGAILAEVGGLARAILTGERVALNFLQRLSGIATMTRQFAQAVEGTKARVADTRKTTPGLRLLEKYAVRVGGGANHRFGLYDAVLIKDNHVEVAGGVREAIARARQQLPHTMKIEVEVKNLEELREALKAKPEIILLDNMSLADMGEAVKMTKGKALLEASGNVTLDNVRAVAETGVDIISAGALTHSVRALDISLKVVEVLT